MPIKPIIESHAYQPTDDAADDDPRKYCYGLEYDAGRWSRRWTWRHGRYARLHADARISYRRHQHIIIIHNWSHRNPVTAKRRYARIWRNEPTNDVIVHADARNGRWHGRYAISSSRLKTTKREICY